MGSGNQNSLGKERAGANGDRHLPWSHWAQGTGWGVQVGMTWPPPCGVGSGIVAERKGLQPGMEKKHHLATGNSFQSTACAGNQILLSGAKPEKKRK